MVALEMRDTLDDFDGNLLQRIGTVLNVYKIELRNMYFRY